MNPDPNYTNDHARLLDKLSQSADAEVKKAADWLGKLATAKAETAAAEERFASDLKPDNARELVEAADRVRGLSRLAEAIENAGGAEYVRVRYLQSPLVYSTFAKGFAERIDKLQTMVAPAAKRLGERRALMSEAGIHFALIETDPTTAALRAHCEAISAALASATFGKVYADKRGVGHEPRSFENLYGTLTARLPQAPAVSLPAT